MRHTPIMVAFALVAAGALAPGLAQSARDEAAAVDAAFATFWAAKSPDEAAAAVPAIVRSGVTIDEAARRLRQGRAYASTVERGVVRASHRMGQTEFPYTLDVPATYDPSRPYQVRFQLHGGVSGRSAAAGVTRGDGSIGALAGAEQIYVLPLAWNDVPWWGATQVESLRVILDRLKRTYNVDENRVVLSGVSDGGTSAYFVAMRETTPFASFLPLNGALLVLANESLGIPADLYPNNLLNKPFFVVNGGRDPLYPPDIVEPYVEHMKANGVSLDYRPQPSGVHNTAWWPEMRGPFEEFVRGHARQPHPAKVVWETDAKDTSRRAHWLVIDELQQDDRPPLADLNRLVPEPLSGFGLRVNGTRLVAITRASSADTFGFRPGDVVTAVNGRAIADGQNLLQFLENFPADTFITMTIVRNGTRTDLRGYFSPGTAAPRRIFKRTGPSGRVDLVRTGNTVQATTRGVAAFTLLVSPDAFDLSKPIKVVADGRTVFDATVRASLDTMMKWAARDNDRTMLYGAEIPVRLTR